VERERWWIEQGTDSSAAQTGSLAKSLAGEIFRGFRSMMIDRIEWDVFQFGLEAKAQK
jgi:hypothetical protein